MVIRRRVKVEKILIFFSIFRETGQSFLEICPKKQEKTKYFGSTDTKTSASGDQHFEFLTD